MRIGHPQLEANLAQVVKGQEQAAQARGRGWV
jgi:hypothetical protein